MIWVNIFCDSFQYDMGNCILYDSCTDEDFPRAGEVSWVNIYSVIVSNMIMGNDNGNG